MTYDSASALSAASGQLQHRATAANPFALKPWVWPKTVRATALTTSHGTTLAGAPALRVRCEGCLGEAQPLWREWGVC